ncbi:hypothetical protein MWU58_11320 [Flavobacteriaceae bacterium S0825]|uniref:hypothetical protein n=1 Tax=Gaetbulibacter sp. S0825 TaxID=2720084 RepID=UPI00142FAE68|nr:hypothetical protein [Gaetbulibacter sp. S0825]MCK0109885.1 hypothetical protein [Flavobacteriaceae bacterium S0825]NIX65514.1 hypothetical protein [Gaetbulibacter sp. S0825]
MRKSFFILLATIFTITSCDDGDIITVDLEFDKTLALCGNENSANYVIYDIKTDTNESLTLLFPVNDANKLIFNPIDNPHSGSFNIDNNTVKFNYRTYNGDPEEMICQEIPSSTVSIIRDYEAENGTVYYTTTYEDDLGVRTVTVEFTIENLDLDILNSTNEFLGTYTYTFTL